MFADDFPSMDKLLSAIRTLYITFPECVWPPSLSKCCLNKGWIDKHGTTFSFPISPRCDNVSPPQGDFRSPSLPTEDLLSASSSPGSCSSALSGGRTFSTDGVFDLDLDERSPSSSFSAEDGPSAIGQMVTDMILLSKGAPFQVEAGEFAEAEKLIPPTPFMLLSRPHTFSSYRTLFVDPGLDHSIWCDPGDEQVGPTVLIASGT